MTNVILLGLAIFYVVSVIRKLPRIEAWSLTGKRPWACDLCMSFWVGLATVFFVYGLPPWTVRVGLEAVAGVGTGFLFLSIYQALPPPPGPDFPRV